ncbi:MAG: ATP-binding cassette domain-containing protein [Burkholderiaceae bacterium]
MTDTAIPTTAPGRNGAAATTPAANTPLLTVRDLKVHFPIGGGLFGARRHVRAVDGVSFSVPRGTTFGIVGESGSGKSTTALAVMRLAPITAGSIHLGETELSSAEGEALRSQRHRFQMIFQDPFASLNPRKRAGDAIREALDLMNVGESGQRAERARELFLQTGLRPEQLMLFPHQFSGGQRQRIVFARALAANPELVVCDEPVSALDVAIQAQILNLMKRLQKSFALTYLFISHDLGVVRHMCDQVAVMYLGRIVELAPRERLFGGPKHPYTLALWSAAPSFDPRKRGRADRIRLQGDPPSPIDIAPGCRFAGRCPFVEDRCRQDEPELRSIGGGHLVACHRVGDDGRVLYPLTAPPADDPPAADGPSAVDDGPLVFES